MDKIMNNIKRNPHTVNSESNTIRVLRSSALSPCNPKRGDKLKVPWKCGPVLLSLKAGLKAELALKLIDQTLAALAYIEQLGFSYPSLTGEDILCDSDSSTFKLGDTVAANMIPQFALAHYYDLISIVKAEYAAPELFLYSSRFDTKHRHTKDCITDELPEPDLSHQDVYAWGMCIYYSLTLEHCTDIQKQDQGAYAGFLATLDNLKITADHTDSMRQLIAPLLRVALAFDQKMRPRFHTLHAAWKLCRSNPSLRLENLIASRCMVCGDVNVEVSAGCSSCGFIREILCNPSQVFPSSITTKLKTLYDTHPYAIINTVRNLGTKEAKLDLAVLDQLYDILKACSAERYGTLGLILDYLKATAVVCIAAKDYKRLERLLTALMEIEDEARSICATNESLSVLDSDLMSRLLQASAKLLPHFFTVHLESQTSSLEPSLHRACSQLLGRGKERATGNCLFTFGKFRVAELRIWIELLSEHKEIAIKELRAVTQEAFQGLSFNTHTNNYVQLYVYERLLRIDLELQLYQEAAQVMPFVINCARVIFPIPDCNEYERIFQGLIYYSLQQFDKASSQFQHYFVIAGHTKRKGNIANFLLAHYYVAMMAMEKDRSEEALTHFGSIVEKALQNPPYLHIYLDSLQRTIDILMKQGKCRTSYHLAKLCCELKEQHEPNDKEGLAWSLLQYSYTQRAMKLTSDADASVERAYGIIISASKINASLHSKVLFERGNQLYRYGRYEQAKRVYQETKRVNDTTDAGVPLYKLLLNTANVERALGITDVSLALYKDVLQQLQKEFGHNDMRTVKTLINLGTLLINKGAQEAGTRHLHAAEDVLVRNKLGNSPLYRVIEGILSQIRGVLGRNANSVHIALPPLDVTTSFRHEPIVLPPLKCSHSQMPLFDTYPLHDEPNSVIECVAFIRPMPCCTVKIA